MQRVYSLVACMAVLVFICPAAHCQEKVGEPEEQLRLQRIASMAEMNERVSNLQDAEYSKYMEITDEQQIEISKLRTKLDASLNLLMNPERRIADPQIEEDLWQASDVMLMKHQSKLESILMPHQHEAYRQYEVAKRLGFVDDLHSVKTKTLEQFLELTPEQSEKLKTLLKEYQQGYEKESKELEAAKSKIIEKSRKEAFEQLSSQQRKEYRELLGEPVKILDGRD